MRTLAHDSGAQLDPDPSRVVARLFLPGGSTPGGSSRTEAVLERVLATPETEVAAAAAAVIERFGNRHDDLPAILGRNAAMVRSLTAIELSPELAILVGSVFTAEFGVEGTALCNPSAVPHPDQSGLEPGQLRVLLSLRSIGEFHLSSIQFAEAVIGPGHSWEFAPRIRPLELATIGDGQWTKDHFLRAVEHSGHTDELARAIAQSLPDTFGSSAIEEAVQQLREPLLRQPDARAQLELIRLIAGSSYQAVFDEDSRLSQRVLLPVADEESRGVEDARFVRFTDADGRSQYLGTYTAYNGHAIANRLLVTEDFRTFGVHRLTGPASQAKGMAMFPRPVGGRLLALGRGDGESIGLTSSPDGLDWSAEEPVYRPEYLWDAVQSGNCGPPIEVEAGWLVLTHGVGPMRNYCIGAILLDLDDPSRVLATLPQPLLETEGERRNGYVPNVAYSCGGIVHEGTLWLPYGIADDRIRVARVELDALLGAMRGR
ncbi:putative GH43/DUF377 family glycosyl hydrolase [Propionicimonas paludicola]|uniref:Putative GH43/DUF377 family glycosyl hydrolase n=1 Tax=Propionicimonas paludicola TaxID=185243 RepID=A0A2A9CP79_9ACTN|nr:glycoside hydrolase family 130 protein [Propionicimonas paludicola]PFG16203.1 putative GH43/DUF377 family glycosyl hydrolase [Propionicimonas paludicola]